MPALANDAASLRVSTLLGEQRSAVLLFESDELDPPALEMARSLSAESARVAAEPRGS